MKPLYRYGIIALCFAAFFTLAPVLVVYTTGDVYDFGTHRFVKTGMLSVATSPSGAKIFLDGKLVGTSPEHVRFLAPGDYDVKITKAGYDTWDKRLNVRSQFTTFVNPNISALYLYKSRPAVRGVAQDAQDFVVSGNALTFATPHGLFATDADNPSKVQQYGSENFTGASLTASPSGNFVLVRTATSTSVFDVDARKITTLTFPMPGPVSITDSGNLYWLDGSTLSQVLPTTVTPVLQNVLAFAVNGQGVYAVQKNNLVFLQLPTLAPTTLRAGLPSWQNVALYVNSQDQVFISGDGALYAVNSGLDQVGSYVQTVRFYENYSLALFATDNELDLYDTSAGSSQLVARMSSEITSAQATPGTATAFFIGDGKVQGIETDPRDHQNTYTFADAASANAKFWVSDDGKYVVLLDGTALEQLQIR